MYSYQTETLALNFDFSIHTMYTAMLGRVLRSCSHLCLPVVLREQA